jgi:hypothetical protein
VLLWKVWRENWAKWRLTKLTTVHFLTQYSEHQGCSCLKNFMRFCTTQMDLISSYAHLKSAKYSRPIFTTLTIFRLHYMKITLGGFHPKLTINVERRHKMVWRLSLVRFPLRTFARNQQNLINILWAFFCQILWKLEIDFRQNLIYAFKVVLLVLLLFSQNSELLNASNFT